ncbi:MAG: hypothetical protein KAR06_06505 [Deltaproteobacteria bacterium]|nr:hypothetical protein [Deltaproteobacteria bacterium]
MNNIIAIDPGSIKTGYAFISEGGTLVSGILEAPGGWGRTKRISHITGLLDRVLFVYSFDAILMEVPGNKSYQRNRAKRGQQKNIQSLVVLGMAIGVMEELADSKGLTILEADAAVWTQGTNKKYRKMFATTKLGRPPIDDNEADAVCLLDWYMGYMKQSRQPNVKEIFRKEG